MKALGEYSFENLCSKPTPASWSLGQLYLHLINDTQYYIEQLEPCLSTNDNNEAAMNVKGKVLFLTNDFPDTLIAGHPDNAFIPQPVNKEQLIDALKNIKETMNGVWLQIKETPFNGKTQHPGFGYLTAAEWFQFAEIHFRHHFRQKKRLDDFLANSYEKSFHKPL